MTGATFPAVLAGLLRSAPGRPLVTFYDGLTGERTELSVTTYANWVAKASGLLSDLADLERGGRLSIDLPPHWLGVVFAGAALNLGAEIATPATEPDVVVCGPATIDAWAPRASQLPVLACSLLPLGVRFRDPLPTGVWDVGVEIWGQPDAFTPFDPPDPDDLAIDGASHAELLAPGNLPRSAEQSAAATPDGGGDRLLSQANPASPSGLAEFLKLLSSGGSIVLVAHPEALDLAAVAATERAVIS